VRRQIVFASTVVLTIGTLIPFAKVIFTLVSLHSDFVHVLLRTQIAAVHGELLFWLLVLQREAFRWNLLKQWQLFIVLAILINVYYLLLNEDTCNDSNYDISSDLTSVQLVSRSLMFS
jgi:heme/copper-type cytochrome/quinol oxidase subunit 4